ncbi:MAG TPA: hypothetical protein VLK58_08235 [Conexibacter sp.]|nr:hypothetical protein [Conexibacter sp.]
MVEQDKDLLRDDPVAGRLELGEAIEKDVDVGQEARSPSGRKRDLGNDGVCVEIGASRKISVPLRRQWRPSWLISNPRSASIARSRSVTAITTSMS